MKQSIFEWDVGKSPGQNSLQDIILCCCWPEAGCYDRVHKIITVAILLNYFLIVRCTIGKLCLDVDTGAKIGRASNEESIRYYDKACNCSNHSFIHSISDSRTDCHIDSKNCHRGTVTVGQQTVTVTGTAPWRRSTQAASWWHSFEMLSIYWNFMMLS